MSVLCSFFLHSVDNDVQSSLSGGKYDDDDDILKDYGPNEAATAVGKAERTHLAVNEAYDELRAKYSRLYDRCRRQKDKIEALQNQNEVLKATMLRMSSISFYIYIGKQLVIRLSF